MKYGYRVASVSVVKTLKMHAIQLLFVTKIKTDIHDETLELSPLILTAPNAKLHWPLY